MSGHGDPATHPSRGGKCSCGATAEVLFQQPRCTRRSCRYYDSRIATEVLDLEDRAWYADRVTYGSSASVYP